jgi:hypothetical protein
LEFEVGRTSEPNCKGEFWVKVIGAAIVVDPVVVTEVELFWAHAGAARALSTAKAMLDFVNQFIFENPPSVGNCCPIPKCGGVPRHRNLIRDE